MRYRQSMMQPHAWNRGAVQRGILSVSDLIPNLMPMAPASLEAFPDRLGTRGSAAQADRQSRTLPETDGGSSRIPRVLNPPRRSAWAPDYTECSPL